jgi:dTDP-4-dehydrorhamnose reductase
MLPVLLCYLYYYVACITWGADTRLDCTAIAATFGIKPRPWRVALAETIDRLLTKQDIA